METQAVHFIAIGGSAMHNLALALANKGYHVTGSDDQIFSPSRERLEAKGLLPEEMGWFPEKIHEGLDAVILGMHARQDNPELLRAQELGLHVYSYPEYIFQQSQQKQRVVIGGSHGKTTITSMILHVLQTCKRDTDFMVGALLEGFDCMVKLEDDCDLVVLEGDEYLSSPIDRRPKFLWYKPQVAVLSGIAWDHINVFPTFENYVDQFRQFIGTMVEGSALFYNAEDQELCKLVDEVKGKLKCVPYQTPDSETRDGVTYLKVNGGEVPLLVFGEHNLQNMEAARNVCEAVGIESADFYAAISTFRGASKRMELICKTTEAAAYKDFAHSPSKLKASTKALKDQYPERTLVACMELHTFSSLSQEFLEQYEHTMDTADEAYVYFNPKTVEHKRLDPIAAEDVQKAFASDKVRVYTNTQELQQLLRSKNWNNSNLLLMSSGNFDGVDLNAFGEELILRQAQ